MYAVEEELFLLIPGLLSGIPSGMLGLATYVLSALAIYSISRRRGLRKPWLAWVPVFNIWLIGSLSDQYQYVVQRENKSRRKWLLGLSILLCILWVAVIVLAIAVAGTAMFGGHRGGMSNLLGPALGLIGVLLPLAAAVLARYVIRCMALYDLYKSLDPDNCVLFLVMSILFRPTEAFFLFFNRDKDKGMPPRRQAPVYEQPQSQPEFWENDKDYL